MCWFLFCFLDFQRERRSLKGDVLARQTWEMAVMCHEESFMSHWEHPSCFPCILSPKDAFGRAQEANFAQHWPGWSLVRHDKETVSASLAAWRNGRGPSSVWPASKCWVHLYWTASWSKLLHLDTFFQGSTLGWPWQVPRCRHGQNSARSQALNLPSCSQLRSDSVGDLDSHSLCSWVAQVTSDPVSSSFYLNDLPLKLQNESNSPRGIPQTAPGFAGGCESSSHLHDQSVLASAFWSSHKLVQITSTRNSGEGRMKASTQL